MTNKTPPFSPFLSAAGDTPLPGGWVPPPAPEWTRLASDVFAQRNHSDRMPAGALTLEVTF